MYVLLLVDAVGIPPVTWWRTLQPVRWPACKLIQLPQPITTINSIRLTTINNSSLLWSQDSPTTIARRPNLWQQHYNHISTTIALSHSMKRWWQECWCNLTAVRTSLRLGDQWRQWVAAGGRTTRCPPWHAWSRVRCPSVHWTAEQVRVCYCLSLLTKLEGNFRWVGFTIILKVQFPQLWRKALTLVISVQIFYLHLILSNFLSF